MDDSEAVSLEQIRAFLAGSGEVRFTGLKRAEVYHWVERTLVRHEYANLGRADKGVLRRYVGRMTGLGRAQVTRLIAGQRKTGRVKAVQYQRTKFATRYTAADVGFSAGLRGPGARQSERPGDQTDTGTRVHRIRTSGLPAPSGDLGGTALSIPKLGRLSCKCNATHQPTRPTVIPIGERRRPQPQGLPGYLRIDTVHQGDQDGCKGIYHINAVDQVTQWEIVAATPQISELWLIPLLETMLQQFPFVIRGFHSDNGSEFINYTVARLLSKLLIEQTKSRAHHSGDNGLVEAKNGAVIRKHLGFGHIGVQHAAAVDTFHRDQLNPYVNFHRPCAVPSILTSANGKRRRIYLRWATPFELFQQVPHCQNLLRPGVTLAQLEGFAQRQSDTEAALDMQRAKRRMLARIAKLSA